MATDSSTNLSRGATSALHVDIVPLGRATVGVRAYGEVDLFTAPLLQEQLTASWQHRRGYVLNLTGVTFFGTAGLRLLATWQRTIGPAGSPLALVLTNDVVRKALSLLELNDDLPRFSDEAAAVAHIDSLVTAATTIET